MLKSLLSILILFFFQTVSAQLVLTSNDLTIDPGSTVDLGQVVSGQTKTQVFTLKNLGSQDVIFETIYLGFTFEQILFLGKDFPGTGGTCMAGLKPTETCTFIVAFKPNTINKPISTFIKITYLNGQSHQNIQFNVAGIGIETPPPPSPATLQLNETSYSFGFIKKGSVVTKNIHLTNTSTSTATGIQIVSESNSPFELESGTCQTLLSAGSSCLLSVHFSPQTAGFFNNNFSINYFDGISLQSINLHVDGRAK